MARGFTDIYFAGGSQDGLTMARIPTNQLSSVMSIASETFFAEVSDGRIAVMKGQLTNNWVSYKEDLYTKVEKSGKQKSERGVTYKFWKTEIVDRCLAVTKKNKQCLHRAIGGMEYCATHNAKN